MPNSDLYGEFDSSGNFLGLRDAGGDALALKRRGRRWVACGDSMAANEKSDVGDFHAANSNGVLNWLKAMSGGADIVLANYGVGGKTSVNLRDEQLASVIASGADSAWVSCGHNDIYVDNRSGKDTAKILQYCFDRMYDAGVEPNYGGIYARSFSTDALHREARICDDEMMNWAAKTGRAIIVPGYRITADPASANGAVKAGWMLDGAPAIHINQIPAYWIAKALKLARGAAGMGGGLSRFVAGVDSFTKTPTLNLLDNVHMGGNTGTAGANVSGAVPDGWEVVWTTRAGTGQATVSVVDVVDAEIGCVIGRAIRVNPIGGGGAMADGDEVAVRRQGFNGRLVGGDIIKAQGIVTVAAPVGLRNLRMRVQTNTTESTWWGSNLAATGGGSEGTLPEGGQFALETRDMTVLGNGVPPQAMYEWRVKFAAGGSGTFDISHPAVKKVV